MNSENPMRNIRIEKVTINIGVGESGQRLENAVELLKRITGKKPIKTVAKVRIPSWGIRKGIPIGVKVTLRKKDAEEFLKKAFEAVDNKIKEDSFDKNGNFSFGIKEYIELPGMRYDPRIGIFGMDVSVTLERPGFRIKKRRLKKKKIGKKHLISKDEAVEFIKEKFGVEII